MELKNYFIQDSSGNALVGALCSLYVKGTTTSGRNGLGGQGSTLTGVGLNGGIAQVKAYNRALNDSDIEALSLTLMRDYRLT